MARYKTTDAAAGQGYLLEVDLRKQLIPGTYEYMLNEIIGTKIDISIFDKNYKNDQTGASAIPPEVLLKLIIYGYRKGIKSSRGIWELNNNNIVVKALTGDMNIHWTTIADFISMNSEDFKETFALVLFYCNELELIGGTDYSIDGLRLPSNASMDASGTKEELEKRVEMYRKMSKKHIERHLKKDAAGDADDDTVQKFDKRQKHLSGRIEKLDAFIKTMEKKIGKGGEEIKSNVTDNDSAMIHSSKGYIQGYIGMAVSDSKNQIITGAIAAGSANEGEHLPEILDEHFENIKKAEVKEPEAGKEPTFTMDSNYFSEENLRECEERGIEAIIPDGQEKRRLNDEGEKRYDLDDFNYDETEDCYECPNGKKLSYKRQTEQKGVEGKVYQASLTDCKACPFFSRCSWSKKEQSALVQGKQLRVTKQNKSDSLCQKMRKKFETEECQAKYARRIQIIEPVFADIRYCKGLDRFTLRGKEKVNGQWLLYCMVHNLGKCLDEYNERRKSA